MKKTISLNRSVLFLVLLAPACGPGENPNLPQCPGEIVCTLDEEETGMSLSIVHAPDKDSPTYFSFASPNEVAETDAWELGFAHTTITVNGGSSGDAGIEVAMTEGVKLVDLAPDDVPTDGWFSDADGELAFDRNDKWYDYDLGRHVIEVRPRVYFVRLGDGTVYGLQFVSYYDYTGASRYVTFRWTDLS